jgi:hypothetical protein
MFECRRGRDLAKNTFAVRRSHLVSAMSSAHVVKKYWLMAAAALKKQLRLHQAVLMQMEAIRTHSAFSTCQIQRQVLSTAKRISKGRFGFNDAGTGTRESCACIHAAIIWKQLHCMVGKERQ